MLPAALPALASVVCASDFTSRGVGLGPGSGSAPPEVRDKQVESEKVIPPWRRKTLHRPGVAQPILFEFFAGDGHLSIAMREMGFEVCADDLLYGGTDFLDEDAVEEAKSKIQVAATEGRQVAVHLAPPCATFSRARDRSKRTRLRSTARPRGLDPNDVRVREANEVADRAFALASWAARKCGALVTLENPQSSYMWAGCGVTGGFVHDGSPDSTADYEDIVFTPCIFGASFQKPTKVRCWNWRPKALAQRCVLQGGVFTCGRTQENPHEPWNSGGGRRRTRRRTTRGCAQFGPTTWQRPWSSTPPQIASWRQPRWWRTAA